MTGNQEGRWQSTWLRNGRHTGLYRDRAGQQRRAGTFAPSTGTFAAKVVKQ